MENKNRDIEMVPVHLFKTITQDGKLTTRGFVEIEDFRRIVNELKPIEIRKVIFSWPATIVLWADGTKTVVKVMNEDFDMEKGLAMAICKRMNGNKGSYFDVFKKYCHKEEDTNQFITEKMFENYKTHIDTFSEPEVLHMKEETTTVKE